MWKRTKASFPANIFFFCSYITCITHFPSYCQKCHQFSLSYYRDTKTLRINGCAFAIALKIHLDAHTSLSSSVLSNGSCGLQFIKLGFPGLRKLMQYFVMYNTSFRDCVASSFPFPPYVYSIKSSLRSFLETKINYSSFNSLESKKSQESW